MKKKIKTELNIHKYFKLESTSISALLECQRQVEGKIFLSERFDASCNYKVPRGICKALTS